MPTLDRRNQCWGLVLVAALATTLVAAGGTILPPIPGPAQRQAPIESIAGRGGGGTPVGPTLPVAHNETPAPAPRQGRSTLPGGAPPSAVTLPVATLALAIDGDEDLVVTAGPAALVPGQVLLRVQAGTTDRPVVVLVAVALAPERAHLQPLIVDRR